MEKSNNCNNFEVTDKDALNQKNSTPVYYEGTKKKITFEENSTKNEDELICVCISDTHSTHQYMQVPDGDILIHGGDFTKLGLQDEIEAFSKWLGKLPHKHKVVISGNHENSFDLEHEEQLNKDFYSNNPINFNVARGLLKNCIYLEHSSVTIEGIKIFGTPYQPIFYYWGWNRNDQELEKQYKDIPDDSDIVITHNPPYKILDKVCMSMGGDPHVGCKHLRENLLKRVKPKVNVFGHIHEAYGIEKIDDTIFINASSCTFRYKPTNKPVVFKINKKTKEVTMLNNETLVSLKKPMSD